MTQANPLPASTQAPAEHQARALVDLPSHGVTAGRLITTNADTLAALVAAGAVDPHPDATAYALSLET